MTENTTVPFSTSQEGISTIMATFVATVSTTSTAVIASTASTTSTVFTASLPSSITSPLTTLSTPSASPSAATHGQNPKNNTTANLLLAIMLVVSIFFILAILFVAYQRWKGEWRPSWDNLTRNNALLEKGIVDSITSRICREHNVACKGQDTGDSHDVKNGDIVISSEMDREEAESTRTIPAPQPVLIMPSKAASWKPASDRGMILPPESERAVYMTQSHRAAALAILEGGPAPQVPHRDIHARHNQIYSGQQEYFVDASESSTPYAASTKSNRIDYLYKTELEPKCYPPGSTFAKGLALPRNQAKHAVEEVLDHSRKRRTGGYGGLGTPPPPLVTKDLQYVDLEEQRVVAEQGRKKFWFHG